MTKLELLIVLAFAFLLGLVGAVWMWGPYGFFAGSGVLFVTTMFVRLKEGSRG